MKISHNIQTIDLHMAKDIIKNGDVLRLHDCDNNQCNIRVIGAKTEKKMKNFVCEILNEEEKYGRYLALSYKNHKGAWRYSMCHHFRFGVGNSSTLKWKLAWKCIEKLDEKTTRRLLMVNAI